MKFGYENCRLCPRNCQINRLEGQKKDGTVIIQVAYPDDVDPSYFRDKIQAAAGSMEKPVRLDFSC